MKIKVSFYLKSTSKKLQRKAIYANIRFAGKQKQFATGLFCEDPDKLSGQRGGFVGPQRNSRASRDCLTSISTIEGFDSISLSETLIRFGTSTMVREFSMLSQQF